jgi:putative membrane-bound dehydrogenase-like protein
MLAGFFNGIRPGRRVVSILNVKSHTMNSFTKQLRVPLVCALFFCVFQTALPSARAAADAMPLRVLFLGDNGHHRPADRFKDLEPVLAGRQMELVYTDSLDALTPANLAGYDCLLIYANHVRIEPAQEQALLGFVQEGGGLVPIHCASFCFLNSQRYVTLVGAQFKSHGTGVFQETILQPGHPVMTGLEPIESWDESYVHTRHNPDRQVLAERRDGDAAEPYTWIRQHGRGRVFYTAWGHDGRTWTHAGFQKLVENGIRWASANSPSQLRAHVGLKPFEYAEAADALPNYVPHAQWGTQADPIRTMQKPLDPEESLKHLVLMPGFQASLFAAEPDIAKAIWMSWDARGRLWIAETVDYPNNLQPPGQGHDRIKICEDTDGDGRADRFTVFADQLSVPTGFVFARGGLIVVHSGKTEFLRDTDGDDRADEQTDLFVGWGTRDTHAGPSNLRYGFDNWIWGTVGYSGFQGTVGGKEIRFGQGIFRFRPDGSALEFIRSSNNNTWGLGFSEDGIVFGSTANGNASMYLAIPNRYYEAVGGWSASRLETIADSQQFYAITAKVRQVDWHDKYTAGAGSALYTARSFPKEYWNRVQFVAEPTGHLLGKFHLEAHGADFVAHNGRNLLASDDEWTAPICAEVGPDGALWVIDWYNYIVQHNPTPRGFKTGRGNAYETPLRDQTHGRILRVAYTGRGGTASAEPTAPNLAHASSGELIAALKHSNMLWRTTAQQLLVDRGQTDVLPGLVALVQDDSVDELGLNPAAIHALWTLHGLGTLDGSNELANQAVTGALRHASAAVRRAAVMVLPRTGDSLETLLSGELLRDADAQVRLATLLALSEMPASTSVGAALVSMLQEERNSSDTWIPDAAVAAAARHDAGFLTAVLANYRPEPTTPAASAPGSLIANGSFEAMAGEAPAGWRTITHNGSGSFAVETSGRTGTRSVRISSEKGGDLSWAVQVPVQKQTEYRLTGWIKTQNLEKIGNARGAMLNIHEMQDPVGGGTPTVSGTGDWSRVDLSFNSGELSQITVNCLFGGWGHARGTAWFDDIELRAAPGSELIGEVGRVVRLVTTHYAQRGPVDSIVATLAALDNSAESLATPILDGLVFGWPQGTAPTLEEADGEVLNRLMASLPESARDRLLALAQRWGRTDVFGNSAALILQSLQTRIADASLSEDDRIGAARRLLFLADGPESVGLLLSQIEPLTLPTLATGFVGALTESRHDATGKAVTGSWSRFTPSVRRAAIGTLLRRTAWANALLEAIEQGSVVPKDLATEQWAALKANPDRDVSRKANRLASVGGAISADLQETVTKLLPLAKEPGDAKRGAEVFTANCAVCHTFNGTGGKVGPDLTGIGARDPSEVLIDILDPNRSVESNFRLWSVSTQDGETFSGLLETETRTSVEILDTTGTKHVIQRKEITAMAGSQLSVMPNGFDALPPDDLKALLTYLTKTQP